jgi:YARHG domain
MQMFRGTLIIIFILTTTSLLGQIPKHIFNEITGEDFNSIDFSGSVKSIEQKAGVYHFGESEAEWDLVFLQYNDSLIIQIWNFMWGGDIGSENLGWIHKCKTFNDVTIEGNKFFFGGYSGLFADYKKENKSTKALLLFSDPINGRNYEKDSAEVGFFSTQTETYFDDKDRYELSLSIKSGSYFTNKTKQELKIMRNMIFANYGQLFQPNGEMDKYFRQQKWYTPFQKDVSGCLTEIEKRNIETVLRLEQSQ